MNYLFDRTRRSGKDVVRFRSVQSSPCDDVRKWVNYRPEGVFGYESHGSMSSFRLFAPRALAVDLRLFPNGVNAKPVVHPMMAREDGSWTVSLKESCEGMPYEYSVARKDLDGLVYHKEVADPYARSMIGRNGPGLAISVHPSENSFAPPAIEDAVVVEAHLRDLIALADGEFSPEERLGFTGLQKWLQTDDCYLRKLGANVIELQPVQEFDARESTDYHWGYMPVNFFSPASSYSLNPETGSGVEEFRRLVNTFHDAGMAVVLDVVYNHMGIPPGLVYVDRELYFITDDRGNLTNHSGCGNDLRCEAEPVRKLVLDSLTYWVETFGVDGFRFDLGELVGIELLREAEEVLSKIKPGILLFAEPWSFRGRLPREMKDTSYALWSDACREGLLDFVKGSGNRELVENLLNGRLDADNRNPCQSVNYLESHDDYCLVDRFRDSFDWERGDAVPEEVGSRVMLALGLLFISPGVPMISAGQDFLRHKQGRRNTYLRGDLNALDYKLAHLHARESAFVRSMIQLRRSEHGLRPRSSSEASWEVEFPQMGNHDVLAFRWRSNGDDRTYLVLVNPTSQCLRAVFLSGEELYGSAQYQILANWGGGISPDAELPPLSFHWLLIP